jgi:hypothetical protein
MSSNMNSPRAQQHQPDQTRTVSHDCRWHSQSRTRGDIAPTPWISLAHAALNQAKMAAPRTASASSRERTRAAGELRSSTVGLDMAGH